MPVVISNFYNITSKYVLSPISNSILIYLLVSEHLFQTHNNQKDLISRRGVVLMALLCDLLFLFILFFIYTVLYCTD